MTRSVKKNPWGRFLLLFAISLSCQKDFTPYDAPSSYVLFEEEQISGESELIRLMNILNDQDFMDNEVHYSIFVDDDCYYYSIYEIVHGSFDLIFGKVLEVNQLWLDYVADIRAIHTFTVVQVFASLKGNVESKVVRLQDFGGRIGDISSDIFCFTTPQYSKGELVLVPLKKVNDKTYYETFARSQGKFTVMPK